MVRLLVISYYYCRITHCRKSVDAWKVVVRVRIIMGKKRMRLIVDFFIAEWMFGMVRPSPCHIIFELSEMN